MTVVVRHPLDAFVDESAQGHIRAGFDRLNFEARFVMIAARTRPSEISSELDRRSMPVEGDGARRSLREEGRMRKPHAIERRVDDVHSSTGRACRNRWLYRDALCSPSCFHAYSLSSGCAAPTMRGDASHASRLMRITFREDWWIVL